MDNSSQETKKRELFQETFPTENYNNLEPNSIKTFNFDGEKIIVDKIFHYIDKKTSRTYDWDSDNCVWKRTIYR